MNEFNDYIKEHHKNSNNETTEYEKIERKLNTKQFSRDNLNTRQEREENRVIFHDEHMSQMSQVSQISQKSKKTNSNYLIKDKTKENEESKEIEKEDFWDDKNEGKEKTGLSKPFNSSSSTNQLKANKSGYFNAKNTQKFINASNLEMNYKKEKKELEEKEKEKEKEKESKLSFNTSSNNNYNNININENNENNSNSNAAVSFKALPEKIISENFREREKESDFQTCKYSYIYILFLLLPIL